MWNLYCFFAFLIICNTSYSQKKTEDLSLESKTKKSIFKCYPNPVETELFVLGTNKIKSIEFIDVLGKRVGYYHFNKSIIKMDVSKLKSGIYLMQVIDENNKQETKKLVVK